MQTTSTPCITLCRIDGGSGLCIGCGRSAREIGAWVEMTEEARLGLMATLPERFVRHPALGQARAAHEATLAARVRSGRRRRL